jgi:hypothetical protein
MSDQPPVGPYEMLPLTNGRSVPLYLVPFDKEGRCQGPLTLRHLLDAAKTGDYTDIHIFSHGWNNVFKDAVGLYREFYNGYLAMRAGLNLNDSTHYRPLLVGITWPSTVLVMPWEQPPHIAALAGSSEREEVVVVVEQRALREVASEIRTEDVARFYELAERGRTLTVSEAQELAQILLPIYQRGDTEVDDGQTSISPADLLRLWQKLPNGAVANKKPGFARDDESEVPSRTEPVAAGILDFLDPRRPIQLATVLLMKDRAGTVDALGVGPGAAEQLLDLKRARVHLIGHSYGAKVMLSALCYQPLGDKVTSLLLLQPAVSYLCFAENVDGKGRHGGYRHALERMERPILSTFSSQDQPLTKFFHLAVRRDSDLGEQKIAGVPPSKYAALGGFGPGGLKDGDSSEKEG